MGKAIDARAQTVGFMLFSALLAGCGGGGSTASTPATPTPTFGHCGVLPGASGSSRTSVIGSCPTSDPVSSTLTFDSNPQGLGVKLNGTAVGTTPTTQTPGFSASINTYTIVPSNSAQAFTYTFSQTDNGNHTIFYNQTADTNGSIGVISTSDFARRVSSVPVNRLSTASSPRRFPARLGHRHEYDDAHVLVSYRASVLQGSGRAISDIEKKLGVSQGTTIGPFHNDTITRLLPVPAGQSADAFAAQLRTTNGVVEAHRPHMRFSLGASMITPNDPLFDTQAQWGIYRISGLNGWGYTTGSSSIAVAVIDTGIDVNQGDFGTSKVTYGEKILDGTVTFGTAAATDLDGHGTNVAGIAAAATNNAFGTAGVGFNTSLQAYRIFPDPVAPSYSADPAYGSTTADEAQAIYDAVAHGAKVINLSLGAPPVDTQGGTGFDVTEHDAVEYAISQGVVVVAAAGNDAADVLDFPAGYDGVISVGASALNDGNTNESLTPQYNSSFPEKIASYSNSGPGLNVVAPGGDPQDANDGDLLHWITNAYSTTVADPSQRCSSNPCIAQIAGTSQATPHVAGAVALMLALNSGLSPAQIAQILESTADDIGAAREGHGRLNVYRALAAVKGDSAPSVPTNANFVAIAYTPKGTNIPTIINVTYPSGVAVSSSGSFRIADIPTGASGYKIGVWYDANGNGLVDAGDWFGSTTSTCSASAACSGAQGLTAHPVSSGFTLN